jgi:hypothetical protein
MRGRNKMIVPITKTIVISGLFYVTPKIVDYLSTRSSQRNLETRIDRLRERLASIRENIVENIGDLGRFFCSDVMVDNAWISVLALSILSKGFKTIVTIEDKMNAATGIIAFSCVAWAVRLGLCMIFPYLKSYIGSSKSTNTENQERVAITLLSKGSLYENLLNFLRLSNNKMEQIGGALQEFNLLALEEIPLPLHADGVFRRYICPITHQPIRFPVGDPNGNTIYERSAILNWLQVRRVSPITRRPLFPHQLIPKPGLQALIDHRLGFHERRLWNYLQQSLSLQRNLEVSVDSILQEREDREISTTN